ERALDEALGLVVLSEPVIGPAERVEDRARARLDRDRAPQNLHRFFEMNRAVGPEVAQEVERTRGIGRVLEELLHDLLGGFEVARALLDAREPIERILASALINHRLEEPNPAIAVTALHEQLRLDLGELRFALALFVGLEHLLRFAHDL